MSSLRPRVVPIPQITPSMSTNPLLLKELSHSPSSRDGCKVVHGDMRWSWAFIPRVTNSHRDDTAVGKAAVARVRWSDTFTIQYAPFRALVEIGANTNVRCPVHKVVGVLAHAASDNVAFLSCQSQSQWLGRNQQRLAAISEALHAQSRLPAQHPAVPNT